MTDVVRSRDDTTPRRGAMGDLTADELRAEQAETLATPRRRYGVAARVLFRMLDLIYGRARTLSKFKVLELVARVPYQSWEQVGYIAITHVHERRNVARRIHERVIESRRQQDNEQWHLLILDELIQQSGGREGRVKHFFVPQAIAFVYYQVSWLLFVVRPAWSYRLNADFEDHAQHEYALLVEEHPEWETTRFTSEFRADYAELATVADLFRQISHDEKVHKEASVVDLRTPRFGA